MYLRDLDVWASDTAKIPRGGSRLEFNRSTNAPVEAYLDRLPRRTVVLHTFAKVNVAVGRRPPGEETYHDAIDVAIIYWPWFDFARYFKLSRADQQKRILEVLHKSLLRIAKRTGSRRKWYDDAYAALMRCSFPLPEISDYELRRRWGLLTTKETKAAKRRVARSRRRMQSRA